METITINDFKTNTKEWLIEKLYRMPLDEAVQAICTLHDELHKYPKTYEECFNICFGNPHPVIQVIGLDNLGNNKELFENFIKLKICRETYWKIAGEEMGLGKPWESDWLNVEQDKYVLFTHNNAICSNRYVLGHNILAFPTAEIRDTFYENFKELIEQCKELL